MVQDQGQISYKLKILFYKEIYSNPQYIDYLTNLLLQTDIFSVEYNDKVFTLKIKKTTIKKKYDHNHDSIFYYTIINDVFIDFISHFRSEISSLLSINNINISINDILNSNIISGLYNIATVSNNIVFLKL